MECAIGRYNQVMTGAQAEKDLTKRKELAKTLVLPAYREVFQQAVQGSTAAHCAHDPQHRDGRG
jgi:hypothetical protein